MLTAVTLTACGTEECVVARTGAEETCDTYDGGQLRFIADEPAPDVSAYCASACVDVYASLAISGYDDLRKIAFLSKVRRVNGLGINVDTLKDLTGLENVDIVRDMELSGLGASTGSKTLVGLTDQEMESFSLNRVTGLESLDGASLRKLNSIAISQSSIKTLNLNEVRTTYVSVEMNEELASVSLGGGNLDQLNIRANPVLTNLSWEPGLTVRYSVLINGNPSLSTCRLQELVDQTKVGPRTEVVLNNGPCP